MTGSHEGQRPAPCLACSECSIHLLTVIPRVLKLIRASLIAQLVKNPLAMRETWVRSLGWEDPLEKGKATHSIILAWRMPWTVTVHGVTKSWT